ncbi:hypothetical protein ABXJ76_14880 [Methylobacter sp. G7]
MKTKLLITLLLALGLVTAYSGMNPHPMDMRLAVQAQGVGILSSPRNDV